MTLFVRFQALEERKAKFDREMLLHGKNLSEDEFRKMMRQHQQEMDTLAANLNKEKERQKKAAQDKVT